MRISDWSSDVCSSDLMSESNSTAHAGHHHGCCAAAANEKPHGAGSDQVIDPVCGMTVDPAKTPHHADHESKTWHFCSAGCRSKFMADPEQYLTDRGDQSVETGPGTVWTCPM